MSPKVAKKVRASFLTKQKQKQEHYDLSARETQVLQLLVKGYRVRFIAGELAIAFDTSGSHLRNIYR